jgi:2,3-bisphosphoglycerate-dependent phosphoglycerate mutase
MTTVYLLRHARSAPDPHVAEAEWPLSATGREQAHRLVHALADLAIDVFVASPFLRAVDTIGPLAAAAGKGIAIEPDLRERALTTGYVDDWETLLRAAWADLSLAHPGGESGRDCQRRVGSCLTALAGRHPDRRILACSHGNAIALFLSTIDARIGEAEWRQMRNPDIFRLEFDGSWTWDRAFTRDLSG